ncbi:MAG: uroporphyrinogen-III synthase, partial [Gemmatimonadota bacterium]|nr:uroporphyrinogen-III synthase [Gemmatimonadota bacterium]
GHERIAVVGPATAFALEDFGCSPALIAGEHVAERLAAELGVIEGERILWPRGDLARKALSETLRLARADVTELVVYRTVRDVPYVDMKTLVTADAITFTSPSGVSAWLSAFGPPLVPVACIGPVTARAAADRGLEISGVADPYTLTGLMQTLRKMLRAAAAVSP